MISERDKARYPFTTEAADYVKKLRIEIENEITIEALNINDNDINVAISTPGTGE